MNPAIMKKLFSFSSELLSQTKNGNKICISLLDDMVKLHDAGEGTTGAEAFDVG